MSSNQISSVTRFVNAAGLRDRLNRVSADVSLMGCRVVQSVPRLGAITKWRRGRSIELDNL